MNVSSAAGLLGLPWHAAYSATKFGLRGISEVLRFDLEPHGIGVTLVCPGAVDTGLVETVEILGIDRTTPHAERMKANFRKHAVKPEVAARAILSGVRHGRYLVFTSPDIRIAHWLERFVPYLYERLMRRMRDRLERVASRASSNAVQNAVRTGANLLVLLVSLLFTIACSGESSDAKGDAGESPGVEAGAPEPPSLARFECPGGTIAEGMNELTVGDQARSFYAEFPDDMSQPVGLVFSWHGYNDPGSDGDAAGWRAADEVDANVDPENPVIVVTPIDIDIDIPTGLDWQLDQGDPAANVDLAFFEAMVGCFDAQFDIDSRRIYSYGFSAGSVMTSLLHSVYPDVITAAVCVSGMWFNDPAQVAMVNVVPVDPHWPALDPDDGGTVLLTHGGPTDVTILDVANLENMAQAAFPFLATAGRTVIDCAHDAGHTLHPELTTEHVMRFFAAHRAGEPSPYRNGELEGYPASCMVRVP